MNKLGISAMLTVALAFGGAWIGGKALRAPDGSKGISKNLALEGDPDGTVAVGKRLLASLQEHDWHWDQVDRSLLSVPDQQYGQTVPPEPGYYTWCQCPKEPYRSTVAFFSELYVHRGVERIPGIEGRLHVTGFFIVGWKDGRVERVPVSDVRLFPYGDGMIWVFPGMPDYDPSLPGMGDPKTEEKLQQYRLKHAKKR